MNWLKSLTVTQSLVTIFVSGFAVALIFATIILVEDVQDYRDVRYDDRILKLTQTVEAVVHEMQIERGLTSAWIAGEAGFAERITEQRTVTDMAVTRMQQTERVVSDVSDPGKSLQTWLQSHRAAVDSGRLDYATHLRQMTAKNHELIGLIAQSAGKARSVSLSRELREDVVLYLAKDTLGLERAMGATILAMIGDGKSVDLRMLGELTALSGGRDFAFDTHRTLSSRDGQTAIGLLERMPPMTLLSEWRDGIIQHVQREAGAAQSVRPLPTPEDWFNTATSLVESLRKMEVENEKKLKAELLLEANSIRAAAQRKLAIFIGLTALFGGCAIIALRSARASLKGLVGAVCRLSVNAKEAEIPVCPQSDLNQIAEALRILRNIQIEQQRNFDAAESLRLRFDTHVHDMLRSVATGNTNRRIELLDLDGPSAVLARGINHLLDQLEVKRSSAA